MFGGFMMNELDEVMGNHMRSMHNMMESMNSMLGVNSFGGGMLSGNGAGMSLMPFGGGSMLSPLGVSGMMSPSGGLGALQQMANNRNGQCRSFSSTTMMMSSGPDGKPQVYRETASSISGPNGVRETKRSVSDSRTGVKKMSVGHHIGDRAHIKEKEQNVYSGQQEETEEYVNLEEEEAEEFNQEWNRRARQMSRNNYQIGYEIGETPQLALPAPPSSVPSREVKAAKSKQPDKQRKKRPMKFVGSNKKEKKQKH